MAEFLALARRLRRIPDSRAVLHRRGVDRRRLRDVVPSHLLHHEMIPISTTNVQWSIYMYRYVMIGYVILCCKLQCGITQPIIRLF